MKPAKVQGLKGSRGGGSRRSLVKGNRQSTPNPGVHAGWSPPRMNAGARATPTGALRVERVAVKKINIAKYNPRKDLQPGDPEYVKLRRSMEQFGYVDTLVWNKRSGNLVGGHQRLKILVADFAVKAVDVSVVELPPAEEKALNLALNKITGEWDQQALAALLTELTASAAIDATLSGFDAKEIDLRIAEAKAAQAAGNGEATDALAAASLSNIPAVLVVCKDVREQKALARELQNQGHQCRMTRV